MISFSLMVYSIVFRESRNKRGIRFETILPFMMLDGLIELLGILYFLFNAFR